MLLIDTPIIWIVLSAIAALALTGILYWQRNNDSMSKPLVISLATMRFLSLFLLFLLFLNIFIVKHTKTLQKPLIVCAIDNSESMVLTHDSSAVRNFFQNKYSDFHNNIAKEYNIEKLTLGYDISVNEDITFNEKNTDISALYSYIEQVYGKDEVAAAIIISDGIHTSGANPATTSLNITYPIFTVGTGDTTTRSDLAISNIRYNRTAYLNGKCVFEVNFKANGYKNEDIILQIFDNDRLIQTKNIFIPESLYYTTFNIDFEPSEIGKHFYKFIITSDTDDYIPSNNEKTCIVDVIEGKKDIVILCNGAHPDIAAITNALSNNDLYNIEVSLFDKYNVNNLSSDDILVLHNLPDVSLKSSQLYNIINKENIPCLTIIGSKTSISTFNTLSIECKINDTNGTFDETYPVINNDFKSFSIDENTAEIFKSFSPLTTPFGTYDMPANTEILAYQKIGNVITNRPLIMTSKDNNRRFAYIFGEGIWQWRVRNYMSTENFNGFDKLFQNIFYYLSLSETFKHFQVNINNEYLYGEPVIVNGSFYDDNYILDNSNDILLIIKDKDGIEYPFYLTKNDTRDYSLIIENLPSGRYTWTATAQNHKLEGAFNITQSNPEHNDLQARHNILQRISENTGGKFVTFNEIEQLPNLLSNLADSESAFTYQSNKRLNDCIPIIIAIIILLGCEWFLRRRSGTY